MTFFYNTIFFIFALGYLPYAILNGKWHGGFGMRFGFIPPAIKEKLGGKENIWIHAVSVGEVLAVLELIDKIKEGHPQYRIVLSTVTKTGFRLAQHKLKDEDIAIFAPLDFSWSVRSYIRTINPIIYITAETEIWPNLFTMLSEDKIPVVQVNGRISHKGFAGYKRIRFLLKSILDCVTLFCMQTREDAQRIIALGASPEQVKVVGNMKFDETPQTKTYEPQDLGLQEDEILWIAGSTHPGEERILLRTYAALKNEFHDFRLVIAPRHIERTEDVMHLVKEYGFEPVRFSQIQKAETNSRSVIVVDTIGHLRSLYRLADIVFIGKTLKGGGGQNVIEPAFFGKPVIIGPNAQNFKNVVEVFLNAGGIIQVKDKEELLQEMKALLKDSARRAYVGACAKDVIQQHQGATRKTEQLIFNILSPQTLP